MPSLTSRRGGSWYSTAPTRLAGRVVADAVRPGSTPRPDFNWLFSSSYFFKSPSYCPWIFLFASSILRYASSIRRRRSSTEESGVAGGGVAGFGIGAVAGFGKGAAAGFGTEGVEADLLVSESTGDCPRTVDGPDHEPDRSAETSGAGSAITNDTIDHMNLALSRASVSARCMGLGPP